ncbi:MAG: hypothetical protein O9262_05155, partial [Cyclobacteriaceae bacterium]|nr:hypothetical protein [Cyclobacteriaceae bacterium]
FGNNRCIGKAEWEINKSLIWAVTTDYIKDGKKLWLAYLKIYPFLVKENLLVFKGGVDVRQTITASGILLSLKDESLIDLVKPLIPEIITEPSLASSLARLYEAKKEREKMLEFIKMAIYLGYDKTKFIEDRNFKAYKGDLDFLIATNTKKYETLFTQYCEQLEIEKLLPLIKDLPTFKGKPQVEIMVSALYNTFSTLLDGKKLAEAKRILKNYLSVIPEIGHSNHVGTGLKTGSKFSLREGYASNAIVLAILLKDDEVTEMANQLIPENITDNNLAYNLACFHSLKRDKEETLRYIKLAIVLGKNKDQFIVDTDFENYKNDPEFLAALE